MTGELLGNADVGASVEQIGDNGPAHVVREEGSDISMGGPLAADEEDHLVGGAESRARSNAQRHRGVTELLYLSTTGG
jgi:hypothetical protein